MLRKSKILEQLKTWCNDITIADIENGFEGFNASTIAKEMNLDRTNVSKELNNLVQEQSIIKTKGRPVYYFDKETLSSLLRYSVNIYEVTTLRELIKKSLNDDFQKIIGSDGSLKTVIKKAKAAMIYPPFGLHTLLIGPTGVGKTMFAEIMYNYAISYGILNNKSEFVVFNCAEYADNPQLLLAQLFGYQKGAFTGAQINGEGLVSKANNGILFLDEIHRLPPEGQEMLFMLMDKGEYRPLGGENIKANVLIIAATTVETDSVLLNTFLRRIPMIIKIPPLSVRPIKERFDLIEKFFYQEYSQVKIEIHVRAKIIKALLAYECTGNIGQLKADIRLVCARGYLEHKTQNFEFIDIKPSLLTDSIYNGLIHIEKHNDIDKLIDFEKHPIFIYNQETSIDKFDFQDSVDIYNLINQQYDSCILEGLSKEKINANVKNYIEDYLKQLLRSLNDYDVPENEELFKIISPRIYKIIEIALQIAEQKLHRKISKKVYIALALHVSALQESNTKRNNLKQNIYDVVLEHPNEYQVAKVIKNFIENELDMKLQEQENIFITMFLTMENEIEVTNSFIGLLVLAHGNGIAQNMVEVANTLMRTKHAHALDMGLKQNVEEFLDIVSKKVIDINEGKGVLLLVDMGSLLSFGEIITQRTGIKVRTINMVSTPIVLEAVRKTMIAEYKIDDVYTEMKTYIPYVGKMFSRDLKTKINNNMVIISTCMTGEGAALKLGKLLESAISLIKEYNIEIIACNKESFNKKNIEGKRVLAVVGAIDLHIENSQYISSDKLILEDGIERLNSIIINETGETYREPIVPNLVVNNLLTESLIFLNPIKANAIINKSFHIIEKMILVKDYNRMLIGYILHMGCMIERIIKGEALKYRDVENKFKTNERIYRAIKTGMEIVEDEFQIKVCDSELAYVIDIFEN
ncbi:MAG: sigma 54-interacting transcriptional regulator [Erysipelotrichaceae bacterium]